MLLRHAAAAVLSLAVATRGGADEGMWTFDNPPTQRLREAYGFTPPPGWLDSIRLASVRFNDGGSGAFVSRDGLMATNHHVGLRCIQNLSREGRDYVAAGFLAATREQEPACPGYEVNVLLAIEDVSAAVLGAVAPEMSDKEAADARKAAMAQIEKRCADETGQRCDVITLYEGAAFDLYRYKKYTDVRLVFAPEQQIAFFGGDPDNFTFPRHDLDVSFFRAYENGRPAKPAAYLPWSTRGVSDGELVFVSGNPGSTARLDTVAELGFERDVNLPIDLERARRQLATLRAYAARGDEQARRAAGTIWSLENWLKALAGAQRALADETAMAHKAAAERELRDRVRADPVLGVRVGDAWEVIAAAAKRAAPEVPASRLVGFGGSRLLSIAGRIVRYVAEKAKPNEVRLEEYRDSNLASVENSLFSPAPIYSDLEEVTLAEKLEAALAELGADHPFVKASLQGRAPAEVARDVVAGTQLADVGVRQRLVAGGPAAVAASTDPMIVLARRTDPVARATRTFFQDEIDAVITRAGGKISQARFDLYGKTLPPDATFTLRLAYGVVKGYPAEGTQVPSFTTFYGLYDRSAAFGGRPPWNLPPRFTERRSAIDLATPLDFAFTADTTGGNSGSPIIDRAGELVGLYFDYNIHGFAWTYFYTDERARSVAVDARGILEALRKVYDAGPLVEELIGRPAPAPPAAPN